MWSNNSSFTELIGNCKLTKTVAVFHVTHLELKEGSCFTWLGFFGYSGPDTCSVCVSVTDLPEGVWGAGCLMLPGEDQYGFQWAINSCKESVMCSLKSVLFKLLIYRKLVGLWFISASWS